MHILDVDRDYQRHILHHYNRHAYLYDMMEFLHRGTRRKAMILSGWRPGERIRTFVPEPVKWRWFLPSRVQELLAPISLADVKRAVNKSLGTNSAWVEMDATNLAIADHSFEISMISLALHHMPVPIQVLVLNELRRVTSRHVVIIEPDVPIDRRWSQIWSFVASIIDRIRVYARVGIPGFCQYVLYGWSRCGIRS